MKVELQIAPNIWVSGDDFAKTLVDEVAFDIVFLMGIRFRDKEAALEAVRETAKEIIGKIQKGGE